jgi:hypothetical protein
MKYFLFAFMFVVSLVRAVAADEIKDVCTGILSYAGRDEMSESRENRIASDIYSQHCEGGSAKTSSTTTVGLEAVVKAIPVKFNFGTGSNDERLNSFCKNYQANYSSYSKENLDRSIVVRESLKAFDDCINMASKDIYFSPKIGRTQVAIDVRRGGEPASIQGITYDKTKIQCMLPPNASGPARIATVDSFRPLEQAYFPIICERKVKSGVKGAEEYPRAEISIATNRGILLLPIPEDALLPGAWSSELRGQLDNMKAKLDAELAANAQLRQRIAVVESRKYSIKMTRTRGLGWGHDQELACDKEKDEVAVGNDFTATGNDKNSIIVYCAKPEIIEKN